MFQTEVDGLPCKEAEKGDLYFQIRPLGEGKVHMYFPLSNHFMRIPAGYALTMAWLIVKWAVLSKLGSRWSLNA